MELPDTVGSSIDPTIPGAGNYDRTYLAAYDRHTGAILWWMYFYHRSGGTSGQDMAVASDGTVYLLLIGHPGGLDWIRFKRAGEEWSAEAGTIISQAIGPAISSKSSPMSFFPS
jgi:hypothetical protein